MRTYCALLIVGAGIFSIGCHAENSIVPTGNFVRASGNKIYLVNFEKESNELLFEFPSGTIIEGKIYQIDVSTILLSLPEEGRILTISLQSGAVDYIGSGLNPVYLPKYDKILYFGKDSDGHGALLMGDRHLNNPVSIATSTRYDPMTIINISAHEVVFPKGKQGDKRYEFWKYDIESSSLQKLPLAPDCLLLSVWRSRTNQFICQKISSNRFDTYYYLMGLDGSEEQPLDYEGYLNIGEYLPELDAILIQKTRVDARPSEHVDLWVYNFADNSQYRVMTDAGFAIDSFLRLRETISPENTTAKAKPDD